MRENHHREQTHPSSMKGVELGGGVALADKRHASPIGIVRRRGASAESVVPGIEHFVMATATYEGTCRRPATDRGRNRPCQTPRQGAASRTVGSTRSGPTVPTVGYAAGHNGNLRRPACRPRPRGTAPDRRVAGRPIGTHSDRRSQPSGATHPAARLRFCRACMPAGKVVSPAFAAGGCAQGPRSDGPAPRDTWHWPSSRGNAGDSGSGPASTCPSPGRHCR